MPESVVTTGLNVLFYSKREVVRQSACCCKGLSVMDEVTSPLCRVKAIESVLHLEIDHEAQFIGL